MKRILATAGTLALAAGLAAGLSAQAQAVVLPPPIHGVITGLHSITLDVGQQAVVGEIIRPLTKGYGSSVPVSSVSGRYVITGWTFLPLNTKGADVTFQVILVPRS